MKKITFCNPKKTVSLSVTGDNCDLNCAHCGRHFLFGMRNAKEALSRDAQSYLVSGGCDINGVVPITESILQKLKKKGAKLNVHSGLVNEEQAKLLGRYVDVVSFDFVGDDETISEVYNTNKKASDYVASYLALKKYTRVVPHICIGLYGGKLSGETTAIDTLARLGANEVTFIIFMPVQDTIFQNCSPPSEADVKKIFEYARKKLPSAKIGLGCMRPRRLYDIAAVDAGLDMIVLPSKKAIELCEQKGYTIQEKDECCSL